MTCQAKSRHHDKVAGILKDLAAKWKESGIRIWRIPVSKDAGHADSSLITTIRGLGFTKVLTGARSNFSLYPARSKKTEVPLKSLLDTNRIMRVPGWACKERVRFLKGVSFKFGKLKAHARRMPGKVRWVFAFGMDRAARSCESGSPITGWKSFSNA